MKIELIIKIVGGAGIIGGGISGITIASIKWSGNNADKNANNSVVVGEAVSDGSSDTVSVHINQNTGSSTSQLSQQVNTQTQTNNAQQTQNDEIISFFVTSKALSSSALSNQTLEGNYQCKFEGKDAVDCKITIPKLDQKLKHSNISEFMQDDNSKTVKINDLKTDKNIFKVAIKKQETENKIDWTKNVFDVIEKTNASKKFAEFDILFVMDGNKLHQNTKLTSFVFKTDSNQQEETVNAHENYRCIDKSKECSVWEFSLDEDQSNFNNLHFSIVNRVTKFVKDKYYWFIVDDEQDTTINNGQIKAFGADKLIGTYKFTQAAFYEKSEANGHFHLFIFN